MRISAQTVAEASPEAAFETMLDVAHWPQFISGISSVEMLTPGPVGVGSRFRETRQMYGRSASEDMTIAEIDAPRSIVLTAEAHGARYRVENRFEPSGSGTRVTVEFAATPMTLLARLAAPLALVMTSSLRRQLLSDLIDLAREAERRSRVPAATAQRI